MLKRKENKAVATASRAARNDKIIVAKNGLAKRRFVLPNTKLKAAAQPPVPTKAVATKPAVLKPVAGKVEPPKTEEKKAVSAQLTAMINPTAVSVDLTETVKTLLHLAQENGYVTYDDINDVLPDGLNPDDLDELFTKL